MSLVPAELRPHLRRNGAPKRAYPNRRRAERHAQPRETVYQCPHCRWWHRATRRNR